MKLSYCYMPNISTLISRGNSKMLRRNKNTDCIKKENYPPQGKVSNRVSTV